jgi:3-dehydroquinate synthase
MDTLEIASAQGPYRVHFGSTIAKLALEAAATSNSRAVVDQQVANLYPEELHELLRLPTTLLVQVSEDEKSLAGCQKILRHLVATNSTKETRLIGIGGGIIQDMVTFCAHVYYRGLQWTYVPSTLLAMADSCIGAKASINFEGFKNQLGVFHSPSEVLICTSFLTTLPDKEISSGYGEILKLHLTDGMASFRILAEELDANGLRNQRLAEFIKKSLGIKKAVIEVDEFDVGLRRTLNYGHTFGHALESISNHSIPHGLAVAWGIDVVNYLAVQQGRLDEGTFMEIHRTLSRHFSWRLGQPIDVGRLLEATKRDKKIKEGKLTLIMPSKSGVLEVVKQQEVNLLPKQIGDYVETLSIVTP